MVGNAPSVSAATSMQFTQVIRPLPCGVDRIIDIDGSEHQINLIPCPPLIVPVPAQPSINIPGSNAVTPRYAVTYLESQDHQTGGQAYYLRVEKGQVFTFRLSGDSVVSPLRTLEIVQITANDVAFMFTPGDKMLTLQNAGTINADIAFDAQTDVHISVKQILGDQSAVLLVWFPGQINEVSAAQGTNQSLIATAVLATIGAVGVMHQLHILRRRAVVWRSSTAWHAM